MNHSSFWVGVTCCFFAILNLGCGETLGLPEVGKVAPRFKLLNPINQQTVSSDLLRGQPVVLCFWSTNCENCLDEIDTLKQIESENQARVVAVAINDTNEAIAACAAAHGINYTLLRGNEELFAAFDGFSTPYVMVLDENWVVKKKLHRAVEKSDLD